MFKYNRMSSPQMTSANSLGLVFAAIVEQLKTDSNGGLSLKESYLSGERMGPSVGPDVARSKEEAHLCPRSSSKDD